jgi:hypothetical protein
MSREGILENPRVEALFGMHVLPAPSPKRDAGFIMHRVPALKDRPKLNGRYAALRNPGL